MNSNLSHLKLAGFLLEKLGHIPVVGEFIEEAGFKFEVIMMDGRRISRIHCVKINEESDDGEAK